VVIFELLENFLGSVTVGDRVLHHVAEIVLTVFVVGKDVVAFCCSLGGLFSDSRLGSVDTLTEGLDSGEDFTSSADGLRVDFSIEDVNILVVVVSESLSELSDASSLVIVQLWVDVGWEGSINTCVNKISILSGDNSGESSGNESSHGNGESLINLQFN
jgi:hypothetical protein